LRLNPLEFEEKSDVMYLGVALLDSNERARFISDTRGYDFKRHKTFYNGLEKFYSDYDRNQELLKFLGDSNFSTNAFLATGFFYAADGVFERKRSNNPI